VLGFVAEILSLNAHMIKLANAGASNVRVEPNGTTVKVTHCSDQRAAGGARQWRRIGPRGRAEACSFAAFP